MCSKNNIWEDVSPAAVESTGSTAAKQLHTMDQID